MGEHHLVQEPIDIRLEERGDTAVVLISGACDASGHQQLRERLLEAESGEVNGIVLDLTAVRFIDSISLRIVIAAWNRARHADHRFSVALATSGQVRRVFEVTGVDQVLPVSEPSPA
jgi:anti-sigma B factor antagonist